MQRRSRLAIEPGGVWVRVPIKTVCLSANVVRVSVASGPWKPNASALGIADARCALPRALPLSAARRVKPACGPADPLTDHRTVVVFVRIRPPSPPPHPRLLMAQKTASSRYVPPHRRRGAPEEPSWVGLDSLAPSAIGPDDSVSCIGCQSHVALIDLSERQVASLLLSLGLGKYARDALSVPLRGRDLIHCTAEDLEAIGFSFRPHRLSLLEEVAKLVETGVPANLLMESVEEPSQQPAPSSAQQPAPSSSASAISSASTGWSNWLGEAAEKLAATELEAVAERVEPPQSPPPPSSAAPAASPTKQRPAPSSSSVGVPSDFDILSAKLEGISLRSEVGTAVQAVQAGKQSRGPVGRAHEEMKEAWKWRPREPPPPAEVRDDVSVL